ncbi:MAG: hypothetical protein VR68_06830 [Peptococcaceae bacterium BRH_c4a]|nr:MAG: hypothetical protein VR68_06830 [Peptococcaceae bacterium BRH_c4a]
MATCRQCRWGKVDVGDPTKGICISGKYESDASDSTSGIAQSVIPGKMVSLSDQACDKFETKPSRAQSIKEGM